MLREYEMGEGVCVGELESLCAALLMGRCVLWVVALVGNG